MDKRAQDDTTILHLNRFAHGSAPVGATGAAGDETELVRKVAAEAVAGSVKPVVVPRTAGPLSADEMLGAVAYCYIKGVFSSADIERKMLRDVEFREALDGVVPDPATIRRFRRLNRDTIQVVLESFYAHLRRQGRLVRDVRAPGAGPALPGRGEENTATFVKREAIERLDQATFVDGMSDF